MRSLIGTGSVVGPTISSLSAQFGLQPLIGKSLAIVSDARFARDRSSGIVLERLLCISGEDTLTIPRKFLGDVTMKLPTRFMFMSNELLLVTDASGALAGRFIVLTLQRSFYGKEDVDLTKQLMGELPGILWSALSGWEQLRARGHFVQPESSQDVIRQMADLASSISAFIRDRCVRGPTFRCEANRLYKAWRDWCPDQSADKPGTIQMFGRDLLAAIPTLKRTHPRSGTQRTTAYEGIGLPLPALEDQRGRRVARGSVGTA